MSVNFYKCKFKLYIDFKVYTFFMIIRMVIHNVRKSLEIKCSCAFYSKEMLYIRKEINFLKNCKILKFVCSYHLR